MNIFHIEHHTALVIPAFVAGIPRAGFSNEETAERWVAGTSPAMTKFM